MPLLAHHCGTTPGSSGSPIVVYDGQAWQVFGMHTCCADQHALSAATVDQWRQALEVVNFGVASTALAAVLR
jgi:hypothetical protein